MSGNRIEGSSEPLGTEGRALTRWQTFRLVVKVVELRLRFIALMAITGLVFAYWDELWARYDKWMRPAAAGPGAVAGAGFEYYCPMHPQVVRHEPGGCPICGMPLARRKRNLDEPAAALAGQPARVGLSPFRVAQAGIETAEVGYSALTKTVETVGQVAFDERRLATIASKVAGKTRVETLHANYTGMDVTAGESLAELYSPELDQAFQELLAAARAGETASSLRTAEARALLGDRHELVRLASEKLRHWGITQPQIDRVLETGHAGATVSILSPISGHLVKKNVVEGQEVPEGFPMFEVADLSTVWMQAQVYENQLAMVRAGQAVRASVEAFPGQSFPGKVEFIQPYLGPSTRTVEVRYSLENPGHQLRPGMFATVVLQAPVADLPEFQQRRTRLAAAASDPAGGRARLLNLTVETQRDCPVTKARLGSMGPPMSADVAGGTVWTCCKACPPKLKAAPAKYLAQSRPAAPPRGEVLSVPESAVIDTGTRQVVYVEAEAGVFEGRTVVLGPRAGDRFPVLEGLDPGDKVAAAGAFLIDAESRLNPTAGPHQHGEAPRERDSMPTKGPSKTEPEGAHGP